jgi:nucleotide-binding universal stress UspA family protein
MYKKILAAVNEHVNSEVAARYALGLSQACEAKFYICFIAEKGNSRSGIEKAEEAVKRLFVQAEQMNILVESITMTGEPVEEIEKIVRHEKINLAFASTRRKDIQKRFYAGTVARQLLLKLPCSVALVRIAHMGRLPPDQILVPLRAGMGHVQERAYFIAMMSNAFHSELFVFHATKPITKFFHGEIALTPLELEKRMPEEIETFMEQIRTYGIEPEKKLIPGSVARSITVEAASKRHDLIIMGASERSFFSSLIRRNPVEDVLRETPCDLIILKPIHED